MKIESGLLKYLYCYLPDCSYDFSSHPLIWTSTAFHTYSNTHTHIQTHAYMHTHTNTHTHTHNYPNVHISFLGAISEHLTVTENHMETLTPDSLTMWTAVLIPSSVPLMKVWVSLIIVTITVTFTVTVTITNNNHNHL